MPLDLTLGAAQPEPLPMPTTAPQTPQAPQPQPAGNEWKSAAPLLALLPLAMKRGGQPAVAALLQGYQQAQLLKQQRQGQQAQQQFQNQRLVAGDQRQAMLDQQAEADRQRAIQNQQLQQRTAFLNTARQGVDNLDDPDALARYQQYLTTAGQPYGVTADDITPLLPTPTKLQQRQAAKKLADLEKAYSDTQRAQLEQGGTKFQIGNESLTLPEIRQRAGVAAMGADGQSMPVPVPAKTDETAPLDRRYFTAAVESFKQKTGREPNPDEIKALITETRKAVGQADDRPPVPREEPLVRIEETDADGNAVIRYAPRSEVAGQSFLKPKAVKEPSQGQYQSGAFAGRMEQADSILGPLQGSIAGMNWASFEAQRRAPATLQTSEMQSYMQASRNFINAVLRRESGAAISPQEFTNAQQQYLPQPGDTAETLAQKAANRQYVFQTMRKSAGNAYEAPPTVTPALTKDAVVGGVYMHNGKKVKVTQKTRTGFLFDEVPE